MKHFIFSVAAVVCYAVVAQAATIETVPVGNPGNAGELSGGDYSSFDRICGAVDYAYRIGKYEVTAGQYTEFLNAVAKTNTYGLYSTYMDGEYGCGITQIGTSGSYTYSAGFANYPVNYVNWGDAARFANWLHNGQPTGAQNLLTTEDGAYNLSGTHRYYDSDGSINDASNYPGFNAALLAVNRETDWKWAVTSEDEWYKAAYHKNDGVTGNYFDYPTSSDSKPSNVLVTPDPGNNANFYDDGFTTYGFTRVGAFELSDSPYGTFDQGGNVLEWNEAVIGSLRGSRGGFWSYFSGLAASPRSGYYGARTPANKEHYMGFRVANVPEPSSLVLLVCGAAISLFGLRLAKAIVNGVGG